MLKLILFFLGCILLSGCGQTPIVHLGNAIVNAGHSMPDDMVPTNLAAMVAFDEEFAGNYKPVAKNVLYAEGIEVGTPEYLYRVARVNLSNTGSNWFMQKGQMLFMTGALIPDHLPKLHAGDIVEIRHTRPFHAMENFSKTGEGNIVLRVMCTYGSADYQDCLAKGPHVGVYRGQGQTHTPYPVSAKSYKFTFTPRYDEAGELIKLHAQ